MIIPLVFFVLFFLRSQPLSPGALNISDLLGNHHHPPHFLEDVLKAIAVTQRWDIESISVSKLENLRFGYSKKEDFFAKIGKKRNLVLRLSHKVDSWKIFLGNFYYAELVKRVKTEAVLRPLIVQGPCVLVVAGNDSLSLHLPMDRTFSRLKQICIGEGITVEIKGAQEVTFGMSSCNNDLTNGKNQDYKGGFSFWPLPQPLHPIHVSGSAYITLFREHKTSTIKQRFVARNIVELLPDKCYTRSFYTKPPCPLELGSSIVALKDLLKSLFGDFHRYQNHSLSLYKACIRASTIVHFRLELRRDVGIESSQQSKLAKWRTQPLVQRSRFDVVASLDVEKLKPLKVKMLRPFIDSDSSFWSDILSNISFTKYLNILVPSLPLTLDVKW